MPPPGGPNSSRLAALEPDIACGERHHLRLGQHRHAVDVEAGEGLARGQTCFDHVPLDPATTTVGHLVFGEGCEKARGGPAFLVRLRGKLRPDRLDARQAQLGEQQLDARGIDGCRRAGHAAVSRVEVTGATPMEAKLVVGGEWSELDGDVRDLCLLWPEADA